MQSSGKRIEISIAEQKLRLIGEAGILAAPKSPVTGPLTRDLVQVVAYGAHEIELDIEAPGDRLLVSSEVDYPGWEVEVDGVRHQKVLVNTAFRGVRAAGLPGCRRIAG